MGISVRRALYRFTAKRGFLKKRSRCKTRWYGSRYGGYPVCPERLGPEPVVYSFGIGEDASFDRAMCEQHAARVFAFDPTPRTAEWIGGQDLPETFCFFPIALGKESGTAEFFLPANPDHVSGSLSEQERVNRRESIRVSVRSFAEIAREHGHSRVDVLKMDIEGSEYDVIPGILECGISIGQILIEFHDRLYPDGRRKTRETVRLLRRHGYEVSGRDALCEVVGFIRKEIE
jgi:FkbM family methyltransferase